MSVSDSSSPPPRPPLLRRHALGLLLLSPLMTRLLLTAALLAIPTLDLRAQPSPPPFRAGAAASNITPLMGVPLDGTISQVGPARHVHDELHARCLVLDDGQTTLALVVVDSTMISREILDRAKTLIEEHTGLPPGHVCISATHSHSTPRAVVGLVPGSADHAAYLDFLAARIADGVRRALNNRAPAEIGWGSFREPRYVHNRRWFLQEKLWAKNANPFGQTGERVRMNPGRDGLDKPAGPVDDQLFLLSVRHADGRPLAVLGNYGLHYIGGIPGGTVSADYFGVFSDRIQQLLGADRQSPPFLAAISNGTSGDVNANDIGQPRRKFKPCERMTQVGHDLAAGALDVIRSIDHTAENITLAAAATELTLAVRKPSAKRLAWARAMQAPPDHKGRLTRPQVYARESLFLEKFPDSVSLPLQAFRIGGLAVAQIPCETFAETGLAIKRHSPFAPHTFTIELANGFFGYLPPPEHFTWGGYETWPARSSFLEEQAEARIRTAILGLLEKLRAGAP